LYSITIFNAQKNSNGNKIPYSPYNNKTFKFETYRTDDIRKLYTVMVSNWILNMPLNKIETPIIKRRRIKELNMYYSDTINYFILDIDKVYSKEAQDKILEYFNDVKCIIGESKSYDGVLNFNMKGIVFIDNTKIEDAKNCISNLHHTLKEYCEIDEAVSRKASLNAPIGKHKILKENLNISNMKCIFESKSTEIKDGYIEVTKKNKIKIDLNNISGDTLEEYCINVFKNMGFDPIRPNENGSISFKHPSEEKSKGGYFWFETSPYTMNHPNSVRSINIFEAVKQSETGKKLMKCEVDYNDAFLNFDTNTKLIKCNEKYLTVQDKKDEIHEFLNNKDGLFSIKSPMGTGKSNIINYIINESYELDMRVLIITNRISVAQDFQKKYNIKLYNKDQYNIGDSLIVQFDSLWRYDIKQFDIVIMDEFISLMIHSRNNLGNSSLNVAKFFGAFNKKLVIADAFLTGYENFLLSNKKTNIFQVNNSWRDQTTLLDYKDKNYFIYTLLHTAKKHKITVSGTSTVFLNSIRELLKSHGLKVQLLDANTPETTKERIYEIFEMEDHDYWDVLLYSPTLTVGVSNINNVYKHFHYDSSRSANVISSIQMIKRTRKAKEIHMFLAENTRYLKINYNSIRDDYMNNIGNHTENNYMFSIDDYGEHKLSYIGRNCVKIDTFNNIMEFNHREGILWMIKYHFFNEPRVIDEKYDENIISHYSKKLKHNKDLELQSNIDEFLRLNDIEKSNIILNTDENDKNKIFRTLIEIDEFIKPDVSDKIKSIIINIGIKKPQFLKQCYYYKHSIDYVLALSNDDDIKIKISESIRKGNDDQIFFNQLLKHGQFKFSAFYTSKPKDKKLLSILEKIGYKMGTIEVIDNIKDISSMSEYEKKEHIMKTRKVFRLDPDIKQYYGFIK